MKLKYCIFILPMLFYSCQESQKGTDSKPEDTLFTRISPEASGIDFINTVENTPSFNIFRYRNFYNGGGVAIGDINNDDLPDVYLTSNQGDNKLFLNTGDFQFEDITDKAGVSGEKAWSTGVVLVDINNDQLLDIYVCNAGYVEGSDPQNELFINNGDLTFIEQAADYNLNESGYTTHTAFFDYDMDGDLDAYVLNNSFIPVNTLNYENKRDLDSEDWPVPDYLKGGGDKMLRNDDGKFVDVTDEAGVFSSLIGFGLGVAVGDVNGDHWPDLYISNDFFERDYLYINQKDGTFKEDITNWMEHLSLFSMGADMADINNDGYPEIFATDMLPDDEYRLKTTTVFENYNVYLIKQQRDFYHQYMHNTLQFNNQNGTFSEIAHFSGVSSSDWSWGALMFDTDNDGYRDIFVSNGIYHDLTNQDFINFFANEVIQKMVLTGEKEELNNVINKMPSTPIPNRLFHNQQDLTFEQVAEEWGLGEPSFSNGAAYGDLDKDGDLDLVINNMNQQAMIYRNHSSEKKGHHFLSVRLKGTDKNTYALGAKVYVYQNEKIYFAEMIPTRGFQSSVDYPLHFGLGGNPTIDSLKVIWPDQTQTVLREVQADAPIVISYSEQPKSIAPPKPVLATNTETMFEEVNNRFPEHKEDRFIDFFQEGLTMRMLSREGPNVAVGDVNGDGLEDVFIGGASGFPGQLFVQSNKSFQSTNEQVFQRDSYHEDTAAAFFDMDGDGDLDLYAGSGGNLPAPNTKYLQDRIYLNDGKGNFSRKGKEFKGSFFNTSTVEPWDFDRDGDLDIFVGSLSIPNVYGLNPPNFLYENDGQGNFKNVISQKAPELERVGMITSAKLVELTGDDQPEIVVVGEWMHPLVFTNQDGRLQMMETNLESLKGWWYGLETADLDGDGDQDLVLGNRGENFYFTGTADAPAKLWVGDFDNTGSYEKILTQSIDGKDMPIAMKDELTSQLVKLKKQNLKHEDYAKRSIQELFDETTLSKAQVKEATYFKSIVALNEGNGQFSIQELPTEIQLSCICGIYCTDLNGDDKNDLILGGNNSNFKPQFSKLDASFGHVLINRGDGTFDPVNSNTSGFFVRGDVKEIQQVEIGGTPHLLVLINNKKPKLFKIDKNQPLIY